MKITKETLKRIIKEELDDMLNESQDSAMMGIMAASMLTVVGLLKDYSEMRAARFSQDEVELSFDQRIESDMQMLNDIKAEFSAADPEKVLKREMDNYMKIVKDNRATGELDHPDDSVINLKNVSHMVTDCWWEGKDVMGKIKVLDTPSGRILKDLINAGVKLGISSRGLGSVKESMGVTTVEEDFQLICFDIVSEPSTPDAYVFPKGQGAGMKMAFSTKLREQRESNIDGLFKKILGD
jgi:hypothetical protein